MSIKNNQIWLVTSIENITEIIGIYDSKEKAEKCAINEMNYHYEDMYNDNEILSKWNEIYKVFQMTVQ